MKTKFLFTRSYIFAPTKGRKMFFELTERYGNRASFRLRDKGNNQIVEVEISCDDEIEKAIFNWGGTPIELQADNFIPKGFNLPRGLSEKELHIWIKTREEVLKDAHLYSSQHREEIEQSEICGCYNCQRTFPPTEIEEWADNSTTAICPYCGTDAVIPNLSRIVAVTPALLSALNKTYF